VDREIYIKTIKGEKKRERERERERKINSTIQ